MSDYDTVYSKAWNIYKESLVDTGFLNKNNRAFSWTERLQKRYSTIFLIKYQYNKKPHFSIFMAV